MKFLKFPCCLMGTFLVDFQLNLSYFTSESDCFVHSYLKKKNTRQYINQKQTLIIPSPLSTAYSGILSKWWGFCLIHQSFSRSSVYQALCWFNYECTWFRKYIYIIYIRQYIYIYIDKININISSKLDWSVSKV